MGELYQNQGGSQAPD